MKDFFKYTFGGLEPSYLMRQYFFGILIAVFYFTMITSSGKSLNISVIAMISISTLLYPYSRFVYEHIINFITGNNTFYLNALIMLFFKTITMFICWAAAIFIAPIGLIYIYMTQTKVKK